MVLNQNLIYQKYIKRVFDLFFSILLIILIFPLFIFIAILIKFTSNGPVFYTSERIGFNGNIFNMPKFRSMKINTPEVATDLLKEPENYLTSIGYILRTTSLDELPQLISIIKGDMSFIGPRPALFNQKELIKMRKNYNINNIKPGLTGFAQIKGRDQISDQEKVKFDKYYMDNLSFGLDFKIIILSIFKVISKEGINH